jgi:kynurenine formamidase
MKKVRLIDLSIPLKNFSMEGPNFSPQIIRWDCYETARRRCSASGINPHDIPGGMHLFSDWVSLSTHSGTHVDAPLHFGPTCEGRPSKSIDQIPLEWCYGDGVVLDVTHKGAGEIIQVEDLKKALEKINHRLEPGEIVLIRTDATRHYDEPTFDIIAPGMGRESVLWVLDQGIRTIGIDANNFDVSDFYMAKRFKEGDRDQWFQCHYLGREREYIHVEKLLNLDQIPRPTGFQVFLFPVKVEKGSGGWCRAVAIVPEE